MSGEDNSLEGCDKRQITMQVEEAKLLESEVESSFSLVHMVGLVPSWMSGSSTGEKISINFCGTKHWEPSFGITRLLGNGNTT